MADTSNHTVAEPPAALVHSRRGIALPAIALALAGGLIWYWLGRGESPGPARGGGRPGASVGVARAERRDVPVYLTAIGTVQPVVVATVRSQLSGTLFSVEFEEGDVVKKGQLLARIDSRPYQLALTQAEGLLNRDRALLAAARSDLGRYTVLLKQDSIARQQVDTQKATVNQLEGTVLADEAAVGIARLNLEYTSLTAPVSGTVGLRQADIGNYVTPSDAKGIVVVTQTAPIDVMFALPQDQLPALRERLLEQPGLPVTARDKADVDVLESGTFLTFDNQIDATTGTIRAKARFANAHGRLFPNQFVNVAVLLDTLSQVVTVPASALRHRAQGDFVVTVLPDQTAKLSAVRVGPSSEGRTVVLSGIDAEATVVTEGADRLVDGSRVTLPAPTQGGADQEGMQADASRNRPKPDKPALNPGPNPSRNAGSSPELSSGLNPSK